MDFSDALRAMQQGHTVRRKAWPVYSSPSSYVGLTIVRPEGFTPFIAYLCADGSREAQQVSNHHMLECDDWEVVAAEPPGKDTDGPAADCVS